MSTAFVSLPRHTRSARCLFVIAMAAISPMVSGKPGKAERREAKRDGAGPEMIATENPQTRALEKLREQLDVADDAEWALISERILQVQQLRRTLQASGAGRTPAATVEKPKPNDRATLGAPERDALRTAVRDNLPDAEIKLRLARAHELHQQYEAKLAKAQEELRSILTLRQEAVAVIAGLLPP